MNRILFSIVFVLAACDPGSRDADGDGIPASEDCDDQAADVSPERADTFGDGQDTNCDGADGVDADGDGVASFASGGTDCLDDDPDSLGEDEDGDGYPACLDCDDTEYFVAPDQVEACDGIDNDCDGTVDRSEDGLGICVSERGAGASVDVLFVVDNSANIPQQYQQDLAQAASAMRTVLEDGGVDYHLGVISTDFPGDQGRLKGTAGVRWVDPTTAEPDTILSNMMELGTGGSADERGRDCAYKALEQQGMPGGFNEGFLSESASLELVFLSNENDGSDMLRSEFIDYLSNLNTPVRVHSVVSLGPGCDDTGTEYIALAEEFHGELVDICTGDYTAALTGVAQNYDGIDAARFLLDPDTDPASLTATVTGPAETVFAEYGPGELSWDAATSMVTLPTGLSEGQGVTFRFALLPLE